MAMAFGLAVIVIEWRRRGTFGLLFAFALALVLFAAFKAAFVRQDITHALHAFATLLPIAGLYAAARREEVGVFFAARPGLARGGVLATYGLVGMVGLGGAALAYRYPGLYVHKLGKFHRNVVAAVDALAGGDRLRREHDTTMAEIRRDWPIKVEGSVAVVGPKQIVAVANGLDLKALPTLNVYQAWSPSLAKRFAAFFETADRPRHLLIETGYYDGRPAWRAIRAQYRAVGRGGQRDHFEHAEAASPRKWSVVSENIRRVSWNTAFELPPLDVPSSETVVVEGKVEPTLLGRVIDLLYQRPYVNLEIERRDGAVASPRFGPIISSIGLAVSPWPLPDESIFAPPPAAVAKRAILKAGPDWSLFYKPEVELTIRRLRLVEAS
ncbi:MAG: hypothetical protein FJX47_21715 [Alphaproteobacteria bacterium]|nr:hypothetical protein [Alphaproteobacteria bacterium]